MANPIYIILHLNIVPSLYIFQMLLLSLILLICLSMRFTHIDEYMLLLKDQLPVDT